MKTLISGNNKKFSDLTAPEHSREPMVLKIADTEPKAIKATEVQNPVLPAGEQMPLCSELHYNPDMTLDQLEKEYLVLALAYHGNNKTEVARRLGVTTKTIFNRLHKFGIFENYKFMFEREPRKNAKSK